MTADVSRSVTTKLRHAQTIRMLMDHTVSSGRTHQYVSVCISKTIRPTPQVVAIKPQMETLQTVSASNPMIPTVMISNLSLCCVPSRPILHAQTSVLKLRAVLVAKKFEEVFALITNAVDSTGPIQPKLKLASSPMILAVTPHSLFRA